MNDETTSLDKALLAMNAAPESDAARLRFYERLADSELFLLLEKESEGDVIEPQLFPMDDGQVVLIFDRELRLAEFIGKPAPYAGLSGRQVVRLLVGQGIGLGVNLGSDETGIVIPAAAVDWLAETLDHRPQETEETPRDLKAPGGVPQALLQGVDAKLASAVGLAKMAYLAEVTYESGRRTHLLAFVDAVSGSEGALATAAGEALTFSGLDAGSMDVAFVAASDPMAARLAKVGLRFDLPEPQEREMSEIPAPGMNPDDPPILR